MFDLHDDTIWQGMFGQTTQGTPFVDRQAEFSVGFHENEPMGPGPLHPRGVLGTLCIASSLGHLWCGINREPFVPIRRTSVDSYPWSFVESGSVKIKFGKVEAKARHVFIDGRNLISEYVFTNTSQSTITFQPIWSGIITDDEPSGVAEFFYGSNLVKRKVCTAKNEHSFAFGYDPTSTGAPTAGVAFRVIPCTEQLGLWQGNVPRWHSTTSEPGQAFAVVADEVSLEPGQSLTHQIRIEMAVGDSWDTLDWSEPDTSMVDMISIEHSSREAFLNSVGEDKAPQPIFDSLATSVALARGSLVRCAVKPRAGFLKGMTASFCSSGPNDFSSTFFWDSLITATALATFNPKFAWSTVSSVFASQNSETGGSPERQFPTGQYTDPEWDRPQSPLASWAASRCQAYSPNEQALQELLPKLEANYRYWRLHSDRDGDGLSEYIWSGQIADNSPAWDEFTDFDAGAGCGYVPPVASVPLSCFLHQDALHLAQISMQLGDAAKSQYYTQQAEEISQKFTEICYVPEDRRFWDFNHATGRHTKVLTFYQFWPVVCGIPMPDDVKRELIEDLLLSPEHFFGPVPFPSVAYSESTYEPNTYWRGKAWPHISYFLICTLWRLGYQHQADEAAMRIIAANNRFGSALENMCTDPLEEGHRGFSYYNWGNAALLLLVEGRYRELGAFLPSPVRQDIGIDTTTP